MPALKMPKLVKRTVKGSPLTFAEGDANWDAIKNFCEALAEILDAALGPDGSLKEGTVSELALQDRSVSQRKMKPTAWFVAEDTGAVNAFAISFTPAITAYENGQLFVVHAAHANSGPATLKVDGLNVVPIKKLGGLDLENGDITAGMFFAVVYDDGVFHLLAGGGASASGETTETTSNFTGLTKYEPGAQALPGVGNSLALNHGLNAEPGMVEVWLRCEIADLGFTAGQLVDIDEFFNSTGTAPAFTTTVTDSQIVVKQNVANIYLTRQDTHTMAQINTDNWRIVVRAARTFNETTLLFPALDVMVAGPDGCISYGSHFFFFNKGTNPNKSYVNLLDMATNGVSHIATGTEVFQKNNIAPFRFTNGTDNILWTSNQGIYRMPLQDPGTPWSPTRYVNYDLHNFKPVWLDETDPDKPILYVVESQYGAGTVNGLRCRRVATNPAANNVFGTDLNLLNNNIVNGSAFREWHGANGASVLLFQYNPIKKRIYVVTNQTGFMHIFNLTEFGSNNFADWWNQDDTVRYPQLTYEGAFALAGYGAPWTNPGERASRENLCVEFDLTTGQEKAICWSRSGGGSSQNEDGTNLLTGTITRVPWRE